MINIDGQKKPAKPSMTVQEFFNSLGKPGQVSDYNWFVNDVQVQLTANQKLTSSVKLNSNLRLESIPKPQSFNPVPGFNITPPMGNLNINPPQTIQQQSQGFSITPPQQQPQQSFNIGPPQPQPVSGTQQQSLNMGGPPQQPLGFSIVPPGGGFNAPIIKPIISNVIKRKELQKSGAKEAKFQIKDYTLEILDFGDKVTLTKRDESFQASLFEADSSPEITKNIQSCLRPNDLAQDEQYIARSNETKVMFTRDLKGIVVRWRTGMASKLEFWLEDD